MDFFGAQDTILFYETKIFLKVVFDNTAFVKFKL
jgi:hypothetical protein